MKQGQFKCVLVNYEPPPKDIRTSEDIVVFFIHKKGITTDDRHKTDLPGIFQTCKLDLKPGEKAFILEFSLLRSQNDYTNLVTWDVDPFFDEEEPAADEEHYKRSGACIGVVADWSGSLNKDASIIYKPNVTNLGFPIIQYIGSEGHILSARSTCVGVNGVSEEYQVFNHSDPFVVFVLTNRDRFADLKSDDIKLLDATKYVMKKAFVEQVQKIFRLGVFPFIKYTTKDHVRFRFKDLPLKTRRSHPLLILHLKLTYIVVRKELPVYEVNEIMF